LYLSSKNILKEASWTFEITSNNSIKYLVNHKISMNSNHSEDYRGIINSTQRQQGSAYGIPVTEIPEILDDW
jgi:hypothetical protein